MIEPDRTTSLPYRQIRFILYFAALLITIAFLWVIHQRVAAELVPVIALLLVIIERRNARARLLAHRIMSDQNIEKLEVPHGEWGELCRAINGLMQERRIQQRLRLMSPALPDDAMHALLNNDIPRPDEMRVVSVLLIRCDNAHQLDAHAGQTASIAWQAIATTAYEQASRHGALLQPCGNDISLIFGVFTAQSMHVTIQAAMTAANALQQTWFDSPTNVYSSLTISLTSGPAAVTILPGLGCCVLGAPIEQALQIERLVPLAPRSRLFCSENVYYVLRRDYHTGWIPTEFRLPRNNGDTETVYRWNGFALHQ